MSAVLETLEPIEALEQSIRSDHKQPRYQFASFPKQQRWSNEAGEIADDFNIDELMMIIADNYEGDGNYDFHAIGEYVAGEYQGALDNELDKLHNELNSKIGKAS